MRCCATRRSAVPAGEPRLRHLTQQLRFQVASPLAPYAAFHYLHIQPGALPLLDSLTARFAREQPSSPARAAGHSPQLGHWETSYSNGEATLTVMLINLLPRSLLPTDVLLVKHQTHLFYDR